MTRYLLPRILALIALGIVSILWLPSRWLLAILGIMTAGVVALDMLAVGPRAPPNVARARPTSEEPTPETLNVDLTRRQ